MRKKIPLIQTINFIFLAIFFLSSSCIVKNDTVINFKKGSFNFTVSNIRIVNNQIMITGTNLTNVNSFTIKEGANSSALQIESKTKTSLVANTRSNMTFAAETILDFVLSNAEASSSFTVNFSLCNTILGGQGFNCTLTPADKDVLAYDATTGKWAPRTMDGISYQGVFSAFEGVVPNSGHVGDYYIINIAGTIDGTHYGVGDKIVLSSTSVWEKINSSTLVTSVFTRTGAITANKGDYTLTKMADVDLTTVPPVTNQSCLKWNGTNWVPGTCLAAESDPTVSAFAKMSLPTCSDGQVLKSNGTTLSCIADNTGVGAFTGTINKVVLTNGTTGALTTSTVTNTELNLLSGITTPLATQAYVSGQITTSSPLAGSTSIFWKFSKNRN